VKNGKTYGPFLTKHCQFGQEMAGFGLNLKLVLYLQSQCVDRKRPTGENEQIISKLDNLLLEELLKTLFFSATSAS